MALDQWLAEASGLQRPLDEVLRHLYAERGRGALTRCRHRGRHPAVTGVDCPAWLDTHVYGKTALPPLDQLI